MPLTLKGYGFIFIIVNFIVALYTFTYLKFKTNCIKIYRPWVNKKIIDY